MVRIDWDPSFSVGVTLLDEQHKKIIEIVNTLLSTSKVAVRSETISDLLTQLARIAKNHFMDEERILEKYGYPDLPSQKEAHRTFQRDIARFCVDAMNNKGAALEDLHQYIKEWWKQHILEADVKYRPFLAECEID